jgi:DNA-directed RNA polymerase subunit omega
MKLKEKRSTMIDPPLGALLKRVDSRYTLVVVVAKRARQLVAGAHPLIECESKKAVTQSIYETDRGLITYIRTKSGIK